MTPAQDLDTLSRDQHMIEANDAPIDACSPTAVSELTVHLIGKVHRRRPCRQIDDVSLGRQHVDPIGNHFATQVFGNRLCRVELATPFDHLPQPGYLVVVAAAPRAAFTTLVCPVRTDAELGLLVHGTCTDLHLEHPAIVGDHRRVQRAVAVRLGVGDVVIELTRQIAPQPVHDTKRGVALCNRIDEHAQRARVVDFADPDALALHLAPDAVEMLRSARELRVQPGLCECLVEARDRHLDEVIAIGASLGKQPGNAAIVIGLQLAKRQILELPLDLPDTEAMRKRRVDIHCRARDPQRSIAAIGRIEDPQRLYALCEPDQRNAWIVDHRHQHPAQSLTLLTPVRKAVLAECPNAGSEHLHPPHALQQAGNLRAKAQPHRLGFDLACRRHLAQHARHQRLCVQAKACQRLDDIQRRLDTPAQRDTSLVGTGTQQGIEGSGDTFAAFDQRSLRQACKQCLAVHGQRLGQGVSVADRNHHDLNAYRTLQ